MADKFQLKAILSAVDKISPTLKNVQRGIKLTHKTLRDIGNAGGELMRKIGIPAFLSFSAITYGAIRASKAAIAYASDIQDAAGRTQQGVEEYQALSNMFGLVGGSAEDAEAALLKYSKGAGEAARGGNKEFASLLRKMKIPLKDSKGNVTNLSNALPQLAKSFARNTDENLRNNMAITLFGKGGAKMIPVLDGIAAGTISMLEAQKLMGSIVGKDSVEALDDLGDSLSAVETQTKATLTNALGKLVPVIKPIVDNLSKWIAANQGLIQTSIVQTLTEVANALKGVDWKAVISDVKETAKTIRDVVKALGGIKGIVIGLGVAFIAGPIAAILSIAGALFSFVTGMVALVGGWAVVGAAIMRVIGFARTLLGILPLIGNAILIIGRALLLTPLGLIFTLVTVAVLIYKNWDKIKVWFSDFAVWIGDKVKAIAKTLKDLVPDWIKKMFGGGTSVTVKAPGNNPVKNFSPLEPGNNLRPNFLAGNQTKLNGEMTVKFENAPPNMRVNPGKSNQPGLAINPDVGYSPFRVMSL
jgi:hypothetical protein